MTANELQITSFLQIPNRQFVIPVYQRNYDWTTSECKELLNDIISVVTEEREAHFIGSIVYIYEGTYSTMEVKELVIIDGQQRLTTLNIIYVALYHFAKSNGLEQDSDRIYNMFLINQYVKEESNKLKLKQTDTNSQAFNAILNGNSFDGFSNVIENYNFFKGEINKDTFEMILNGLNRLIFVEISLERDKDDPQRIFESLNSTGLDLSQSDLIRNFILMDLNPRDQRRVFEQIWNPIELNARDLTKQKSMVSDYIRDYLTLRDKKIPNKNRVYQEFKKLYENRKDENFHQDLETIKSLSAHYKKFINPSFISDRNLRLQVEYINRLEINVAYPFLLQVFEDADNGILEQFDLVRILKLIQSYTWRRFVVGLPTNALNKIFMTLYSEVDTEDYYNSLAIALIKKKGSSKFPTDEEIKVALKDKDLYNIKPKNRNYMFELLENHQNREYVDTSSELITVEHIFPRNPDDRWNEDLPAEELYHFKEKLVNTIGNLTLSGNNGALSNKSFPEKKHMNLDGKEQGYIYSSLWLNRYLKDIDKWNNATYKVRSNLMYKRFVSIWEYPDVQIPEIDDNAEMNIFDAESPTFKKLEYFIFEDTKIEEEAIAQMYFYVIRILYQKNTQLLLDNQDIIKATRNPSDFRTPQELINGYFIEANIDSNTKFRIIKKLLSIYDMEEELIIKYDSNGDIENKVPSRFTIRKNYWKQIIALLSETGLYQNVKPTKDHWLGTGAGISGLGYYMIITKSHIRVELAIASASKEQNKKYFHRLHQNKEEIENLLGKPLEWDELAEHKMSRIKLQLNGVNLYNPDDWDTMNKFFIEWIPKLVNAFRPFVLKLKY